MDPGSKLNVLNLFRLKPNKWTSEQLTGLRIKQHDHVSIATIADDGAVLLTDDELSLANDFAQPTRSEITSSNPRNKGGQFELAFSYIWNAMYAFEHGFSVANELDTLASEFRRISYADLCYSHQYCSIPFHLPSLHIRGKITHAGTYFRLVNQSLPLTMFVGKKGPEHLCSVEEIMPYLLIQAILKYEGNSILDFHTVFVVSMKGTSLQFNKGVISRKYLTDLISHKVPSDSFMLFRSNSYDLIEQKDRKECARGFFGLMHNVRTQLEKYETKES